MSATNPVSREALDFAHLESHLPAWQGLPYGEIARRVGLNRTRVKRAIRWGIANRDDIVVVGPLSTPGQNTVDIAKKPTTRSVKYGRWNTQYVYSRTVNRIQAVWEQHAATASGFQQQVFKNLAASAQANAEALKRDLDLIDALIEEMKNG